MKWWQQWLARRRTALPAPPRAEVAEAPVAHAPTAAQAPPPASTADAAVPYAHLPYGVRLAAAWAWRLLVIGVVGYYVLHLVGRLRFVIVPLAVALLLAALLAPAARLLSAARAPRSLAASVVVVGGLTAVVAVLTAVVNQFIQNAPALAKSATAGVNQIRDWLRTGPLHLSDKQLDKAIQEGQEWLDTNTAALTSGAVSTAATVFEVLAGTILVLFATFFFLRDGARIWDWLVRLFPRSARSRLRGAGIAAWGSLGAYVRATVLVAFIDAIGIGLALYLLDVPLAFPLAALVFLGAFVPIVGATLSGTVAVLVALVDADGGLVKALLVLGAVILVQQLEGHVLQPLIMGKAVALHPLAVIIAITAGAILAGIVGALIAVPVVAVLNTGIRYLLGRGAAAEPVTGPSGPHGPAVAAPS